MKNRQPLLLGIGILLILFTLINLFFNLNPFTFPSDTLLANVDMLNTKLRIASVEQNKQVDAFFGMMQEDINDEENNEGKLANIGLRDTLSEMQLNKNQLLELIDEGIFEMEKYGGIDEEAGRLKNPSYKGENRDYWLEGEARAEKLYNELQEYFTQLADIYNDQLVDKTDVVEVRKVSEEPLDVWAKKSFDGPVITNIAALHGLKIDVLEETNYTLRLLSTRLGILGGGIDRITGVSIPFSQSVVAGTQFKTRLLAVPSYSSLQADYSSNSGTIDIDKNGNTFLTIPANGAAIAKGKNQGKQEYQASMRIRKATGGYETIYVEDEFTVRKPDIVVSSAAVQILYRHCGNDLNIDVPALADQYRPKIAASQAQVIPSKKTVKKFRITPIGKASRVTVNSVINGKTIKIGDVDFKVVSPPRPIIEMAVNGKTYDGTSMIPKSSRVAVRLVPDEDFKASFPADANYGISSIDVLAQLSLGPPTVVNQINTAGKDATKPISVALGTKVRQARVGTKVYIRLNDIYRVNYLQKRIPDKRFSIMDRTLGTVVK